MSLILKYNHFFSVRLNKGIPPEDTSEDEPANFLEGVTFFPTHRCLKNLRNYNLVFRPCPGGFDIFYSQIPLVEIASQLQFTFGFTYSGGHLLKEFGLTDADVSDPVYPGLYFNNYDEQKGKLIPENNDSLTSNGTYVTAMDTYLITTFTFNVSDNRAAISSKYTLENQVYQSLNNSFQVQQNSLADYIVTTINSKNTKGSYLSKPGPYLLKADTGSLPDRRLYLDEEFGRKSVQGVVDIYWNSSQKDVPDSEGQTYNINFKTKDD